MYFRHKVGLRCPLGLVEAFSDGFLELGIASGWGGVEPEKVCYFLVVVVEVGRRLLFC